MQKLPLELTKLLYMRFASTYGDKFVKNHPTDQFVELWWEEWSEGMAGIDPTHIKEGLSYCRLNLEWPPSIAEFRRICEQNSGVPSSSHALQMAIRKDFSHPIVSIAYDKVGSWAMKNDKEAVLNGKFQAAYIEALNEFRKNPNECWGLLENFNTRQALPVPPSKVPSSDEIIGWRERFARYNEMAKADKAKLTPKDHPQWQKENIVRGSKLFDENVYNERKRYLLGVDEITAGTLPQEDWYDRVRYMREIEMMDRLKDNPPRGDTPEKKMPPRAYNGGKRVYDRWND